MNESLLSDDTRSPAKILNFPQFRLEDLFEKSDIAAKFRENFI